MRFYCRVCDTHMSESLVNKKDIEQFKKDAKRNPGAIRCPFCHFMGCLEVCE